MEAQTLERSRAVEDYVKAIHAISQETGGGPVGTNALAARAGVTPASVSGMVRKLVGLGLVTHSPYRGVALTADGNRLALAMVRRHRLLETFLAERLGLPWDRVHAEAEVLEHVISSELEEAIARDLGDPLRDPHGAPIPREDLSIEAEETIALSDLAEGESARFVRIPDERPDMLRWLSDHGIAPGANFTILGRDPFGGPIQVAFSDGQHSLGGELAEAMRVERQ